MSLTHYDYLEVRAPRALEDVLLGTLWQLGYDGLVDVEAGDGFLWKIYFAPDTHRDHLENCVSQCCGLDAAVIAKICTQKTEDWSAQWKTFFKPVQVSPSLVITTEGIAQTLAPGQREVIIVAGMAFGTGQHPTTQLIARAVAADFPKRRWDRVLDVGTGTGILGLVALACGVPHVDAMDIDPDALKCVTENSIKNNMLDRISLSETLDMFRGPYPCLVANILLDPLVQMAPALSQRVAAGGDIYLSGILTDQVESLTEAYAACGLTQVRVDIQEEWAMVHLRKE